MKIERIENKRKSKLIKLSLMRSKMRLKKNYQIGFDLENTELRLKKALHIIYKYHINYKRIMFVSTNSIETRKLNRYLKKTKHICVPEFLWQHGIISNRVQFFKLLKLKTKKMIKKRRNLPKILKKLSRRVQLIVFFSKQNLSILKEGYNSMIPTISVDYNFSANNSAKSDYKIPGNLFFLGKPAKINLFYFLLIAVIKKAKIQLKKIEKAPKKKKPYRRWIVKSHRR